MTGLLGAGLAAGALDAASNLGKPIDDLPMAAFESRELTFQCPALEPINSPDATSTSTSSASTPIVPSEGLLSVSQATR